MSEQDDGEIPQPVTFPAGGTAGGVECSRCGDPASRSYEGVDNLDLCESCFDEFRGWASDAE
ncbi:hypothetical protein EXE42_07025 [Halorubrum sp. SP3]|uniref:hypothetical protein n=1 Tax=Halorubrum sp. SP3 TaxID=1537265 RepID=UPI0010F6A913|nr:hypothetical protein [Halorubrum sp. SP3]TKX54859.1 hypothetical protein EXE42_07025 [Halorubrum sp. SP3]